MRKDQARRLKYQEAQRIQSKAIKNPANEYGFKLSEGQLKSFASKLVKQKEVKSMSISGEEMKTITCEDIKAEDCIGTCCSNCPANGEGGQAQ